MTNANSLSPLALAFVGDSVHTLYVRQNVVNFDAKIGDYHHLCAHFCKAKTQSEALEKIIPLLSFEESEIVRKTRNAKINNVPKNSNVFEYKKATCFEALVGYLFLNKNYERLKIFLDISMDKKE